MRRRKVWQVYPERPELVQEVAARHGLPRLVARLLLNRGLAEAEDILAFLAPELSRLSSPFDLPDLQKASARLARAVKNREPLIIYGDYDADGLTATCLLYQFFQELGVPCTAYVPDRLTEGYGLNVAALEALAPHGRLLVTVDCGVSDAAEVARAGDLGLEVIVTDHHELPTELPAALAVVNPKRNLEDSPFAELAGVGVALLLALGVRAELREAGWFASHPEPNLRSYLDLVALGTAADVVPVVGENRILVRQGLHVMEETRRPGLMALKEVVGLENRHVSFRDLVFRLAPRLNAAGRLGQARGALALLLAADMAQARTQARYLHQLNRQRQGLEEDVLRQAAALISKQGLGNRPVLVLAQEGWHPGVLGIVAARLAEDYHKPVALVSLKDGQGRGSARSIEGFHLFEGLQACKQWLLKFGGHAAAAGFSMRADNLKALQENLEEAFYRQMGREPVRPVLKVDAAVNFPELNDAFFKHLERLRPFGPGNPEPVFTSKGIACLSSRVVGDRHLKVQLVQQDCIREAIYFNGASLHPLCGPLEAAFSTRITYYNGRLIPEIKLLDWLPEK
ncbi:MAG: single-stranded-DNA-specific exonuclease RecJ [Deltaproteobacteria bacterium]|nr:single-stranded-DNA-specific exonuclease RecJ [Deltaproteobacteria bacterium]